MRKLILILLLLATILVAWYYFEPEESQTNMRSMINMGGREDSGASKNEDSPQEDMVSENIGSANPDEQEVEIEPFVPQNPLVEVVEGENIGGDERVFENSTVYTIEGNGLVDWSIQRIGGEDAGTIPVEQAVMYVEDGRIVGGEILLNTVQIRLYDQDATDRYNAIRGVSWFDVKNHETATIEIAGIERNTIQGIITLKGVSQRVEFPATVIVEDDTLVVASDVSLESSLWGLGRTIETSSEFMDLSFSLVFKPESS